MEFSFCADRRERNLLYASWQRIILGTVSRATLVSGGTGGPAAVLSIHGRRLGVGGDNVADMRTYGEAALGRTCRL